MTLLPRPERLEGSTYKITPGTWSQSLYITINDIVIGEERRPFEIFINTKNMEYYEWIVALTRLMSAVFRKGGNVEFVIEEMKAIHAPMGGYVRKGTADEWMGSVIAEIGHVLEEHMQQIGLIEE